MHCRRRAGHRPHRKTLPPGPFAARGAGEIIARRQRPRETIRLRPPRPGRRRLEPREPALLLEGSLARGGAAVHWSLDAAISPRHAWIDEQAVEWAESLGKEGLLLPRGNPLDRPFVGPISTPWSCATTWSSCCAWWLSLPRCSRSCAGPERGTFGPAVPRSRLCRLAGTIEPPLRRRLPRPLDRRSAAGPGRFPAQWLAAATGGLGGTMLRAPRCELPPASPGGALRQSPLAGPGLRRVAAAKGQRVVVVRPLCRQTVSPLATARRASNWSATPVWGGRTASITTCPTGWTASA